MKHRNDGNCSIALAEMLPLVCDWAEWVSLQKDVRESDIELLTTRPDIRQVGNDVKDFADTAALVEFMDLVVTVDTSVAHLAGAMGKPVWILNRFETFWRWLLERTDSPWYASVKLFRQPAPGDWASVIHPMREELESRFSDRCR